MKTVTPAGKAPSFADVAPDVVYPRVAISLRSRLVLWQFRMFLKPLLARLARRDLDAIARTQMRVASMRCPDTAGLKLDYRVVGGRVPGHVLGTLNSGQPVLLWLHGGAFMLPAAPIHLTMVARLCRDIGAAGFVPDYRLAPANRFPAALDDCERAYRTLLERGHDASQIVLAGDSAGATLALGVLQRIRAARLPMPACAVAISPITEMGRMHAPPSRHHRMRTDPLLPVAALRRVNELYAAHCDTSDPELSPMYMDCEGLPPMLFMASDAEILVDETIMLAGRAQEAGVAAVCHVWPQLPHAFPLFEKQFPEVRQARIDIVAFARRHLRAILQELPVERRAAAASG